MTEDLEHGVCGVLTGELFTPSPRRIEAVPGLVERSVDRRIVVVMSMRREDMRDGDATLHTGRGGVGADECVPEVEGDRVECASGHERLRMTPSAIAALADASATSGATRRSNTDGMT